MPKHLPLCLFLILVLSRGTGICAEIAYVSEGDSWQALDYGEISDYESSPEIELSATSGSKATGAEKRLISLEEIKNEVEEKVDINNDIVVDAAVLIAAKYPGAYTIEQVCAIYSYLKNGDESTKEWSYVSDPRGPEYYRYANHTLRLGEAAKCSGVGDCDDFAILMSSFIESIGGTTRVILAYDVDSGTGHAYTEVYLGRLDSAEDSVDEICSWLKTKYKTDKIYRHVDTATQEVWLNMDWWADHPGGPIYEADKCYRLLVRDLYGRVPLNIKYLTWSRTFGGADWDYAYSVQQTSDGGYILAGETDLDAWLIRTDSEGREVWSETFGGADWDYAESVQLTSDGGYVLAGGTESSGAGGRDAWLIKTDPKGDVDDIIPESGLAS